MSVLGTSPITAAELARKIVLGSDLSWDWGERPIKNLLHKLGCAYGSVCCRKKGLAEGIDVQEWLLDLVWIDDSTMAISLAVESEWSLVMAHRLDDFEKLMSVKSTLKLFIYATRDGTEGEDVRRELSQYLRKFSQHLEGEEYLLMDVKNQHADFYLYNVPTNGSIGDVVFTPLPLALGSTV